MDFISAVVICVLGVVFALTGYLFFDRRLNYLESKDSAQKAMQERQLIIAMAEKGYVQVPVMQQHFQESLDGKDRYGEGEDRVSNDRHWQLAWMQKDQAEIVLLSGGNGDRNAEDILQESLRPT